MEEKKTRRKLPSLLRWIFWVILVQFIVINISAAFYAYRLTHFYNDPSLYNSSPSYQAYPLIFPIENDQREAVTTDGTVKLLQTSAKFPAAALKVESSNIDSTESVVSHLMTTCLDGIGGARAVRSFNLICRNGRTWFIPRAVDQSKKAARYFGGLEMGGLFCLPNADEFRSYLPESLRFEIENASLRATENGLEPFISAARQLIAQ